jgi:hypothetical protein
LDNYWTKIDYILELASWLFSNEYFLDNIIDLIDWTIDLLLTSSEAYKQQQDINPIDGQEIDSKSTLSVFVFC